MLLQVLGSGLVAHDIAVGLDIEDLSQGIFGRAFVVRVRGERRQRSFTDPGSL